MSSGRTWACPCSVFTWDTVGVVGSYPSLLIPSCRLHQNWGVYFILIARGSWVVDVMGHSIDEPSVFLCSPACLCVCNYEIKFWACTKQSHQGWREVECRNITHHALMGRPDARLKTMALVNQKYVLVLNVGNGQYIPPNGCNFLILCNRMTFFIRQIIY